LTAYGGPATLSGGDRRGGAMGRYSILYIIGAVVGIVVVLRLLGII
jgi:hypothetical protein